MSIMRPHYIRFAPFGFVKGVTAFGISFDQLEGLRFEDWNLAYQFVRELVSRFNVPSEKFEITTDSI